MNWEVTDDIVLTELLFKACQTKAYPFPGEIKVEGSVIPSNTA